jgi:hypothetical protein
MLRLNFTIPKLLLVFGILAGLFFPSFAQNRNPDIRNLLPDPQELGTWHLVESARVFTGEELFTLIDGGADIYYEYGFQRVVAAKYQNIREQSLNVEIYEMTDGAAAYGMYSLNASTHGKKVQIGNEGTLSSYYLMFWKNTFLVYLTGMDTTNETIDGILSMGKCIDRTLGPVAKKPETMNHLPTKDLTSCKYFRGILGLSSLYTFDTRNIFGVKEGASGSYPTHRVIILAYDSEKGAEENYFQAAKIFSAGTRFSNVQVTAQRCTMTDQQGALLCLTHFRNLIAVVIADDKSDPKTICDGVISYLQRK